MENNNNTIKIAKPWKRLLSYLIDFVISLLLPLFLIFELSTISDLMTILNQFALYFVIIVLAYPILWSLLNAFMISTFGGTWGKLLTGTKIVDSSGEKIGFWRAFFRNHIGYMVSGMCLYLGFIWILVDKESRAWHDMMADTLVITRSKIVGFLGILILAALIFVNLALVNMSIVNFKINSTVYSDLFDTVKTSLQSVISPKLSQSTQVLPVSSPQPTNIVSQISGWKSYVNTKYNYSVEYPSDWTFREFPDTQMGAGFRLVSDQNDLNHEHINIDFGRRAQDLQSLPFEEYVKRGAIEEIQNFMTLASINKVVTNSGLVGYKTTWNIQSSTNNKTYVSEPITYFDTGDVNGDTIQISTDKSYLDVYNKMISTFRFTK